MNKIVAFLFLFITLTACDDGDMVFESLNFDEVAVQKCTDNELYFKIKSGELLLVDFTRPISSTQKGSWLEPNAELNRRISPPANADIKIYYRTYDAAINNHVICSILAPANPKVTSEYTSVPGGGIYYTRTMTPAVNQGVVNVSYAYTIEFENITLTDGATEIKYTKFPFGTYTYETTRMNFSIPNIFYCENEHALSGHNAINDYFKWQLPLDYKWPTTAQTQTINLSADLQFKYIVFNQNLSNISVCDDINLPIKEEWIASEGSLQIETQVSSTGQRHLIKIINARFEKDKHSFLMTDKEIGTFDVQL